MRLKETFLAIVSKALFGEQRNVVKTMDHLKRGERKDLASLENVFTKVLLGTNCEGCPTFFVRCPTNYPSPF